jgi:dinuclear metal center YbgI/SA1388 family protein
MSPIATLAAVIAVLEDLYPPSFAADWDAVGLVCGDPDQAVESVLLAVDTVQAVADEARDAAADLVIAHHPLFLRPVHSIAATHPKGRLVTDLVWNRTALYIAHTNADVPPGGVSDALASAMGLIDTQPLVPMSDALLDKVIVFVPLDHTQHVIDALTTAGAGTIGAYDRAAFLVPGTGTYRPSARAQPFIGEPGKVEEVAENRVEMTAPRDRRGAVVAAIRAAHPYEEPAFDIVELAPVDQISGATGIGRIGQLPEPMTLRAFAEQVADALPTAAAVARVAGDLDQVVRRVAVQGGAGDDLFDVVRRSGADVYVTSDLRHHPALEAREYDNASALVDIPHWAAEWTWLPVLERLLRERLSHEGYPIRINISKRCTDPWNHVCPVGPRASHDAAASSDAESNVHPAAATTALRSPI